MSELSEADKLCFTCPLPPERCGGSATLCRFNEATQNKKYLRSKGIKIQHICGFPDKPNWEVSENMTGFCEQVAKYSEPWMNKEKWQNT